MDIKDFFNKIDDTAKSKQIEQDAKQAKARVFTETTIAFATQLSELTKPYEIEFEKRGFKCEKREGNLPYWSLEVRNTTTNKKIKLAIVNNHNNEYEFAAYSQEQRTNTGIVISDSFDKASINQELQSVIFPVDYMIFIVLQIEPNDEDALN